MKISLPIKLGIAVFVIFGFVVLGMALWKPMKVRYYAGKYEKCADPQERIRIVDILCGEGAAGKKALYDVFRRRCISEQVKIPAGSFMMGSEKGDKDEKPVHEVALSMFWMDKYEVTYEKYYTFVKTTGRNAPQRWENGKIPKERDFHPMIYVSWEDAKAYADWLEMRLPTEAQWEYACRAASTTEYSFGDDISMLGEYAWYFENSGDEIHPVGQKKPNKWGLYDMYGNVWEWCSDWQSNDYYASSPRNNPQGPSSGRLRVLRGGSWENNGGNYKSANRTGLWPSNRDHNVGFRLTRGID